MLGVTRLYFRTWRFHGLSYDLPFSLVPSSPLLHISLPLPPLLFFAPCTWTTVFVYLRVLLSRFIEFTGKHDIRYIFLLLLFYYLLLRATKPH